MSVNLIGHPRESMLKWSDIYPNWSDLKISDVRLLQSPLPTVAPSSFKRIALINHEIWHLKIMVFPYIFYDRGQLLLLTQLAIENVWEHHMIFKMSYLMTYICYPYLQWHNVKVVRATVMLAHETSIMNCAIGLKGHQRSNPWWHNIQICLWCIFQYIAI